MIKICEQCGAEFEPAIKRQKYCCRDCANAAHIAHLRKYGVGIKGAHNGKYRPGGCRKCCIYNDAGKCKYRQDKELSNPIEKWQTCQYFDDGDTFKYERAQSPVHLDTIYGHIAAFKDSHSAVWMY